MSVKGQDMRGVAKHSVAQMTREGVLAAEAATGEVWVITTNGFACGDHVHAGKWCDSSTTQQGPGMVMGRQCGI